VKIKVKEGHAGVMTLNDGTKINYGVIRTTQNMSKIIFYTGKGLRKIFKLDMTEEEKTIAAELKKLDEKTLIKSGHISEILLTNIKETN